MIRHRSIRLRLYEYLNGEFPPEECAPISRHLERCRKCAAEAEGIRKLLSLRSGEPADASRPAEYWANFSSAVEQRLRAAEGSERHAAVRRSLFNPPVPAWRTPALVAAGGALTVALAAVIFWKPPHASEPVVPAVTESAPGQTNATRIRMEQYLRKSKVLLIGLTNADPGESSSIDLSAERQASRQLMHEARYLETQPIDPRSARLIDALDKILIELANMKEHENLPDVEVIRTGIHHENLLFKIRMAESIYDTARTAGYSY